MVFRLLWQQAIVEFNWLQTGFWLMSMTPPLMTSSTGEDDATLDEADDDDVDDADTDNDEKCRDFILYLCPVGELQAQLSLFWQKSKVVFDNGNGDDDDGNADCDGDNDDNGNDDDGGGNDDYDENIDNMTK